MVSRALILAIFLTPALASAQTADEAAQIDFFERKIRPVLIENCYNCHSAATNSRGGLRVDDRAGLLNGGGRGPAIVPGQPGKSLLLTAVHQKGPLKMPPLKQLKDEEVADLTKWIKDGAAWPKIRVPSFLGKANPEYDRLKKEHWAWQPLVSAKLPAVKDAAWSRTDIDRFVLAKLEEKGLKPVDDAERRDLIRRVTYDLVGLPATPAEIDAFLADTTPEAFPKAVDRLLASPAFGERWGRHWLDVARYGESTGSARNLPLPHAWRYRDYVLDAFNNDKPYDVFVREQIAGDLLPAKSPAQRDEQLIATGFLALGVKDVNQRFKVRFIMDNIDEQIDTVTRSFLALTASCARCHDHKFDPIPTMEYYGLAGIFQSSDLCAGLRNKMGGGGMDYYDPSLLLTLGATAVKETPPAAIEKAKADIEKARADLLALTENPLKDNTDLVSQKRIKAARLKIANLQGVLLNLTDPAALRPVAYGVRDGKNIGDTEVRIRGEAEKLGPVAPRGFLSLVNVPDVPKINPQQSGRLELAHWLTSPKNPLTPRVMVNRVWKHLFGDGLVSSVDNFGTTGDVPSHPELLDHLAGNFVQDGWSVKRLIRTIVLSRSYQLSTKTTAAHLAADPANRLVWRHTPRRLDAEQLRDTMLSVAGNLDPARPKGSSAGDLIVKEMQNNGPEAKTLEKDADLSVRRSVYLPLVRGVTPRSLEFFDFADQGNVVGSRDATTVAPQALYLLNDPFVNHQASVFAQRLLKTDGDLARIQLAYRLALGREATAKEAERTQAYLEAFAAEYVKESEASSDPKTAAWASFCQALFASAEFRFVR